MDLAELLDYTRQVTIAQLLERDDFARRFAGNTPISLSEFIYPLLQGIDSVEIQADIELGGTDQTFNNLVGRTLQRAKGQPPQAVLTLPLLVGIDGVEKMGKSLNNYVAISEPASEQFGKLMRIPDNVVELYATLCDRHASATRSPSWRPRSPRRRRGEPGQASSRPRDRDALPRCGRRRQRPRSGSMRCSGPRGADRCAGIPDGPVGTVHLPALLVGAGLAEQQLGGTAADRRRRGQGSGVPVPAKRTTSPASNSTVGSRCRQAKSGPGHKHHQTEDFAAPEPSRPKNTGGSVDLHPGFDPRLPTR